MAKHGAHLRSVEEAGAAGEEEEQPDHGVVMAQGMLDAIKADDAEALYEAVREIVQSRKG